MKVRRIHLAVDVGSLVVNVDNREGLTKWIKACKKAGFMPYQVDIEEMTEEEFKRIPATNDTMAIQKCLYG